MPYIHIYISLFKVLQHLSQQTGAEAALLTDTDATGGHHPTVSRSPGRSPEHRTIAPWALLLKINAARLEQGGPTRVSYHWAVRSASLAFLPSFWPSEDLISSRQWRCSKRRKRDWHDGSSSIGMGTCMSHRPAPCGRINVPRREGQFSDPCGCLCVLRSPAFAFHRFPSIQHWPQYHLSHRARRVRPQQTKEKGVRYI